MDMVKDVGRSSGVDQTWLTVRQNHLEFVQRMCVGSLVEVGLPLDNTLIIPKPTRPSLVLRSPSAEPYHRQDQAPAHLIIYWKFLFQCIGPTIRQSLKLRACAILLFHVVNKYIAVAKVKLQTQPSKGRQNRPMWSINFLLFIAVSNLGVGANAGWANAIG